MQNKVIYRAMVARERAMLRQIGTSSRMKPRGCFNPSTFASRGRDVQLCNIKPMEVILGIVKATIVTTSYVDLNERRGYPLGRVLGKNPRQTWCSCFARRKSVICSGAELFAGERQGPEKCCNVCLNTVITENLAVLHLQLMERGIVVCWVSRFICS